VATRFSSVAAPPRYTINVKDLRGNKNLVRLKRRHGAFLVAAEGGEMLKHNLRAMTWLSTKTMGSDPGPKSAKALFKGSATFREMFGRDAIYNSATLIVDTFWGQHTNVANGLGVLLESDRTGLLPSLGRQNCPSLRLLL
jgi:hypothetical protein